MLDVLEKNQALKSKGTANEELLYIKPRAEKREMADKASMLEENKSTKFRKKRHQKTEDLRVNAASKRNNEIDIGIPEFENRSIAFGGDTLITEYIEYTPNGSYVGGNSQKKDTPPSIGSSIGPFENPTLKENQPTNPKGQKESEQKTRKIGANAALKNEPKVVLRLVFTTCCFQVLTSIRDS